MGSIAVARYDPAMNGAGWVSSSRWSTSLTALSLFLAALSSAGCGNETLDCSSPDLIRNDGTGLCVARCGLQPTESGYQACPAGFTCGSMGCFLTCGMQTCSAREMCDPATMTCVRALDSGVGLDAGTMERDSGPMELDTAAAIDAPVAALDTPATSGEDAPAAIDAFSSAGSCSLGLPTSGTRATVGGARGSVLSLHIAAAHGRVAWADTTGIQVSDTALTPAVAIARMEVQDVAITRTHLYWSEGAFRGSVYRLPWAELTTGTPELVASDTLPIFGIAVSDDALFWTTDDGMNIQVSRARLDGSMARLRGRGSLRSGERAAALAIAGAHVYVSFRSITGATGCFRVLRFDASEPEPGLPLPEAVAAYGPTTASCSATSHAGFAVEGDSVFFHSSAPPEIVEYSPAAGVRRIGSGFGDGSDLGITPLCIVAGAVGLQGIPRAGGSSLPYAMGDGASGTLAVDGVYAYAMVPVGRSFQVVQIGL